MTKKTVFWMYQPTYDPNALLDELSKRRNTQSDYVLAEILGSSYSQISKMRSRRVPLGYAMIVKILYEFTDMTIIDVFDLMKVTDPLTPPEKS